MSALTELKLYLLEKLDKVNINNPKANSGAVLLKLYENYEDDMEDILILSMQVIQRLFTKEEPGNPAGSTPLTNLSIKIGKFILGYMREDYDIGSNEHWRDELRLGDLIVEAFYHCGYFELHYPERRDSSHIVEASPKWVRIKDIPTKKFNISLIASVPEPIEPIGTKNIQAHGQPIIKDKSERVSIIPNAGYIQAINKLQQTPWMVNEVVFNALKEEDGFVSYTALKGRHNKEKELKRRSKVGEWKFIREKANLVLSTLPENKFYQYLSVDYRGRFYYDEPFFGFQGSDLQRGVFMFAEGKLLRPEDTFWLAVHTASSYNQSYSIDEIPSWCSADYHSFLKDEGLESISVDKMVLEDRATWTKQNIDWILQLGKDTEFVQTAEKRVAFLACCVEWHDYSVCEGDYYSHLPIPIDGSNNGWQHLGAISKDPETGELVGLVPIDIQKDFYVQTAKELINHTTDERLLEILEAMPMKHIRKGISKRGSMTRAYSAGAKKIADNMYFDCKVEDFHEDYGITEEDCNKFARLLIQAINTVCPGPLQTMAYFQSLAAFEIGKRGVDPDLVTRRKELVRLQDPTHEELEELNDICKTLEEQNEQIIYGNGEDRLTWTTPSGFSVEYTNWIMNNYRCRGTISGYRQINHVVHMPSDKPDIRGFMCGISPNFIHSMDASHMALVINNWDHTFGAVHDSFSTHACNVEALLSLTKEKFIDMYDVDNFYSYIEDQLITNKENLDVEQPERGSLKIREIHNSDYFFA